MRKFQKKLWTQNQFYLLLGNVFSWVIKLPTQNVFKDVSDHATCHWKMQIFLKTPCVRRQNIPLLQHPKRTPATKILPCKIPRLLYEFFVCTLTGWKKSISLISILLFACFSVSATGQLFLKFCIRALRENNSRSSKFVEIGQKYRILYTKYKVAFIFSDKFYLQKSLYLKEVVLIQLCQTNM